MYTKATGLMTKQMEWESTPTITERLMKASGKTISKTAKVLNGGKTDQNTRAITAKAKSTAMGFTNGLTGVDLTGSGLRTRSLALAPTRGWMAGSTRASGRTIIWRATAFTPGRTAESTRDSTERINKHGFGSYVWADARKYEGYWSYGKQHGLGKYIVPKEGVEKYGLWEDGKRIEWFDDEAVKDINSGDTSWREHFKKPDSSSYVEKGADFNKPKGFDMRLIEIKDRINKLDKNQ